MSTNPPAQPIPTLLIAQSSIPPARKHYYVNLPSIYSGDFTELLNKKLVQPLSQNPSSVIILIIDFFVQFSGKSMISNLVLAIAGDRTQDKIINSDSLYR